MQKRAKYGFLLAEYMVVIGLCLVVVGFSFSLTRIFKGVVTSIEVELLKTVIQAEQAIAICLVQERTIKLDQPKHTYTYGGVTHTLAQSVDFVFPEGALGPPSSPTMPIHSPISFIDDAIICFPTGSISSGVMYIGSRNAATFYALSSGISQWGMLRLYVMKNNKWCKK